MATDVVKVVRVSPAGVVESQDKPGTSHSQVRCADLLVAGFVFVGKAMRVARRIAGRQTGTQSRSAVDANKVAEILRGIAQSLPEIVKSKIARRPMADLLITRPR